MVRILIAEDNKEYRQLLKIFLTKNGYEVYEASDGEEALAILDSTSIHLLIADIMMPNMDGFTLIRIIRDAQYTLPILILSAKGQLEDKRTGFSYGADDYISKDVDMEEILLRIEAILRRTHMSTENILYVRDFTLIEDTMQVIYKGENIQLRQKEFQLLFMLLSYPGKIFTRQTLMDEIWGYDSETDPRTVDVHVRRIREKLPENTSFDIQTVRGLGYRAVI